MEHRRVRRIRRITAEASARCEYTDRRLLLEQRPDLYRRGLRPQQNIIVDIEGVGPVSGRVVRSCVQCIEVVEYGLHLRTLRERKSHRLEHACDLFDGDRQRVLRTDMERLARFGHVNLLRLEFRLFCLFLQLGKCLIQKTFDVCAYFVGRHAELFSLLWRQTAHGAQDLRQLALFAQHLDSDVLCVLHGRHFIQLFFCIF